MCLIFLILAQSSSISEQVIGPNNTTITANYYYLAYPFNYNFKYLPSEILMISVPLSNYVAYSSVQTITGLLTVVLF